MLTSPIPYVWAAGSIEVDTWMNWLVNTKELLSNENSVAPSEARVIVKLNGEAVYCSL